MKIKSVEKLLHLNLWRQSMRLLITVIELDDGSLLLIEWKTTDTEYAECVGFEEEELNSIYS